MLKNVFGIAGTALNAQTIRLNTTASNLANAGSVSGSEEEAYRTKRPVFRALVDQADLNAGFQNLDVLRNFICRHFEDNLVVYARD